jgi:hypothetical protein
MKTPCSIFNTIFIFTMTGPLTPLFAGVDPAAANAGFQYLDVPPSPRQIAMGLTGTALGVNGFAYFNPASPAIDKRSTLSLGYAPMPGDYSIAHAQGSYTFSGFFIGANITNHFVSGLYPTNFNHDPDYNTPFSYDGFLLSLNGGYCSGRLGIGLTINGLQERIGTPTAYGISASAGLVYIVNGNFTLGIAGLHFGTSTGFTEENNRLGQGYALPRSGRAGIAYCDTLLHLPFTLSGDVVYRDVGEKGTAISSRFNRLTVPLGIEVNPTSYVSVRLGKRINDDVQLFTAGAGVSWSAISFDMAFVFARLVNDFELQPFFSLTYALRLPAQGAQGAQSAQNLSNIKQEAPRQGVIEKPFETKNIPAAPVQSVPASASPQPDTIAAPLPEAPVPVPVPAAVASDSIMVAPEKAEKPVEVKPDEQIRSNPQADSLQKKQPAGQVE